MLARNIEQPVLCWKDVVERLGPAASKQIFVGELRYSRKTKQKIVTSA